MSNQATQPLTENLPGLNSELSSVDTSTPTTRNPVLSRLMEEVRNDQHATTVYDRVHNRHNRGGTE